MTRPPFEAPTPAEVDTVTAQLGRPARGVIGIAGFLDRLRERFPSLDVGYFNRPKERFSFVRGGG